MSWSIYKVTNLVNGHKFVGSYIADNIEKVKEKLEKELKWYEISHRNEHLFNGIMEYGYSNFKIELIEVVPDEKVLTKTMEHEQILKPEYGYTFKDFKLFKIVNRKTNEFFVGFTHGRLGEIRISMLTNPYQNGFINNEKLRAAVEKYGIDNFHIELIENFAYTNDVELVAYMRRKIEELKPVYNSA